MVAVMLAAGLAAFARKSRQINQIFNVCAAFMPRFYPSQTRNGFAPLPPEWHNDLPGNQPRLIARTQRSLRV